MADHAQLAHDSGIQVDEQCVDEGRAVEAALRSIDDGLASEKVDGLGNPTLVRSFEVLSKQLITGVEINHDQDKPNPGTADITLEVGKTAVIAELGVFEARRPDEVTVRVIQITITAEQVGAVRVAVESDQPTRLRRSSIGVPARLRLNPWHAKTSP